jgi:hypothetical protein
MTRNGGPQVSIEQRAAEVRRRVLLSGEISKTVKLVKAGAREMTGLCRFHNDSHAGSFMVNDEKGIYKCFACGAHGDVIDWAMAVTGKSFIEVLRDYEAGAGIDYGSAKHRALMNQEWERQRARRDAEQQEDQEKRRRKAEGLWHHAVPMLATPSQMYLAGPRAIDFGKIGRLPRAIRYMPDCWHRAHRTKVPAMVTAIMGLDGRHLATHITYLAYANGGWDKAKVALDSDGRPVKPKIIRGSFGGGHIPINKGVCRAPLKDITAGTPVFISEGIEDALTIAMAKPEARIIAAATGGNIGDVDLPPQCGPITIIGQNDPDGSGGDVGVEKSIGALQLRGYSVSCMWPKEGFKDFNDQLRGVRMKAPA